MAIGCKNQQPHLLHIARADVTREFSVISLAVYDKN